eukprot:gene56831-biopygen118054
MAPMAISCYQASLVVSGSPGSYYGTRYNELETINDCARMCVGDITCVGIAFGTQAGDVTPAGVSDGDANDFSVDGLIGPNGCPDHESHF